MDGCQAPGAFGMLPDAAARAAQSDIIVHFFPDPMAFQSLAHAISACIWVSTSTWVDDSEEKDVAEEYVHFGQ